MFAGEGGPERTNRRFHYLAAGHGAARLSTAFDSTTLYGEDPDTRPDIYGRTGNSGVSIATLDDMKKLYSGFDLCSPTHLGVDDDQRAGADDPRDVHEHRDRPAGGALPEGRRALGGGADEDRRAARGGARARRARCHLPRGAAAGTRRPRARAARASAAPSCSSAETYARIRAEALRGGARHGAGRHPQGGPGAEHLHLLDRVRAAHDGRRAAVLHRPARAQLLLGVDLRLSHRRGRREPDLAAGLHARQRLHDRRVLPGARHARSTTSRPTCRSSSPTAWTRSTR